MGETGRDNLGQHINIILCGIRDDGIFFEGLTDLHLLEGGYRMHAVTDSGQEFLPDMEDYPAVDQKDEKGTVIHSEKRFYIRIPLRSGMKIRFAAAGAETGEYTVVPKLGKFARLVNNTGGSYFHDQGWIIGYEKGCFRAEPYSTGSHVRCELRYLRGLIHKKKKAVAACRLLCYMDRALFQRKPVWLVADRPYLAGDNGEHMFRYLQGTDAAKENDIYFVLKEDSPDFARLKRMGRVLKYGSLRHKIKHLESRFILGSTFNELITNALGRNGIYYRDLRRFDFVFLRHGVSHNDQSRQINRLRLNIRLLVATCRPEYEGILSGHYGYTDREVKLTGLPRYDQLTDDRRKKILILPTWRKDLQGEIDERTLQRGYLETFRESEYFRFYQDLIQDERLRQAMEEFGYTGEFYLHPVLEQQWRDFAPGARISVGRGTAEYQRLFREGAIMVTDYSSVAFDFAYLKKPVIYAQFDEETFFRNHSYGEGYFSYRENGFGPVTATVEQTVDALIQNMEREGRMQEEYLERVDRFFAFTDRNNCRRVYEALRGIEGGNKDVELPGDQH